MSKNIQLVLTLVILLTILYAAYKVFGLFKDGFNFFKTNSEKFDPTSDKNLAYTGVNKVVQALSGDANATLGTKAFDVVDTVKGWFGFGTVKVNSELQKLQVIQARANKTQNLSPIIDAEYLKTHPL